jgi:hypothetical protein
MEKFFLENNFNNSEQSLRKDLILYILSYLNIKDVLQLFKVNLKMHKFTSNFKKLKTLERLGGRLKGVNFPVLLEDQSKMIQKFLTEDMNYQIKILGINFTIDDWKELQEVMIFLAGLKLKKEDKVEVHFDANQRTFFYLKEAFNLLYKQDLKPKKLILMSKTISKYISKTVSHVLLIGKLKEIDFTRCKFSKIGFKNFLSTFKHSEFDNLNNPLKKLILNRCELGDKAIKELFIVITNNFSITHLDLTYNRLEHESFSVLAEYPHQFFLKSLKLDFNEISNRGVKNLYKFLLHNPHLKELSLVSSLQFEKSFNYISKALSKSNFGLNSSNIYENQGLMKLTLGLNNLKTNTVRNFIYSLKINRSITNLELFLCEFSEKGSFMFVEYLALNVCSLKVLDFCNFNFQDNIIIYEKLLESLKINESIEVLKFTSCYMDNRYLQSIIDIVEVNKNIKLLDLRGNLFTPDDIQFFILNKPREIKVLF